MDICEDWLEYDYNPFILFDKNGRIVNLNAEAQFLLGVASSKDIFELASTYASYGYGFKTTIIDVDYGKFSFYAITVGYSDDEHIGIKLYKKPNQSFELDACDNTKVNIYSLIDLCISSFSTLSNASHEKFLDPTFPDIYIKVDLFLKLLSKIYNSFKNSRTIKTKLYLKTGEHIIYKGKKFSIFVLEISGDKRDEEDDYNLKEIAPQSNAVISIKNKSVSIELPLIDDIDKTS